MTATLQNCWVVPSPAIRVAHDPTILPSVPAEGWARSHMIPCQNPSARQLRSGHVLCWRPAESSPEGAWGVPSPAKSTGIHEVGADTHITQFF